MGGGGGKGPIGKKFPWWQIFDWFRRSAQHFWTVTAAIWKVVAPIVVWIKSIWSWVYDFWNWTKGKFDWLFSIYNNWVKPWVNWLIARIEWIHRLVNDLYNGLLGKIYDLYNKTFGWYERLRTLWVDTTTLVARIIGKFLPELSEKIEKLRDDVVRFGDSWTREVRDWAILYVRDTLSPVVHLVNEYYLTVRAIIDPMKELVGDIDKLLKLTIEKPKLLSRDTVEITGLKYGQELWESMLGRTEETPTLEEEIEYVRYIPDDFWGKIIDDTLRASAGPWAVLEKRMIEEATEALWGGRLIDKTPIPGVID